MADEKPKEGVKTENNDHINLKVAGQDGSVVQFKIKRHTPLSKLMKAYCERQGLSMRQIRFRFDGQPINETDTPAQRVCSCKQGKDREEERIPSSIPPHWQQSLMRGLIPQTMRS
ncbi:small ubiquitin-related modifier 2 isoform X1 [Panthera uncia]|uniref:small ubiquitin-related modifier 2 isoform X1 n=1 Tax=Panthera uncia TaxID=29064 RepID=UPI0020FFEBAD|nr:small ubiquitin-related modifier 2 isoform X1 [Panthera uncia]